MGMKIRDLHVEIEGKEILRGVNLTVADGEVVALMGRNGSGKSTLANVLMGNPRYKISHGKIEYNGKDITVLDVDERARLGIFMSFQNPVEVGGVSISNFLRTALNSLREENISVLQFRKLIREKLKLLDMDDKFLERYLNEGFSGGEKKKAEILQLAVLEPKFAILDETDSGTDVDALRIIAEGINKVKSAKMSILLITHYNRIFNYIKPDKVLIMEKGRIVKEGSQELAKELEEKGYSILDEDNKR